MIDVFSPLGAPAPGPVQNWTGVPEPPLWKELTGGMSWPPTGAFPPSPPPACALVPTWPCNPWPPPAPPLWPAGWPWPLPLPPPPGAALPAPPPAVPAQPPPPAAPSGGSKSEIPWGLIVVGGLAVGAALLFAGTSAGVLDNPSAARVARALVDAEDGSFYLARLEAKAREARAKTEKQRAFWRAVLAELAELERGR